MLISLKIPADSPQMGHLTLDQAIEGSNPSSPAASKSAHRWALFPRGLLTGKRSAPSRTRPHLLVNMRVIARPEAVVVTPEPATLKLTTYPPTVTVSIADPDISTVNDQRGG